MRCTEWEKLSCLEDAETDKFKLRVRRAQKYSRRVEEKLETKIEKL